MTKLLHALEAQANEMDQKMADVRALAISQQQTPPTVPELLKKSGQSMYAPAAHPHYPTQLDEQASLLCVVCCVSCLPSCTRPPTTLTVTEANAQEERERPRSLSANLAGYSSLSGAKGRDDDIHITVRSRPRTSGCVVKLLTLHLVRSGGSLHSAQGRPVLR
jgi:hypothetical protein